MPGPSSKRYAYNRTRKAYLATSLVVADSHWSRFRGLMATDAGRFPAGSGLWIVPCRGVHTFGMRFPIDVLYLDSEKRVVHLEHNLRPWRMAPIRLKAATVIEVPCGTLHGTQTGIGDVLDIGLSGNGAEG
jgi:uncharacterized membrane protein (UPF0127 family)